MVPIHDTDLAAERWSRSEWDHVELWEKVEVRLRRRRWLWIIGTAAVFLSLSSVPIVLDRLPRWKALAASRRLAEQLDSIKKEAGFAKHPFRIRFIQPGTLRFSVEQVEQCSLAPGAEGVRLIREGDLERGGSGALTWIDPSRGERMGIPGLSEEFCYDPYKGSSAREAGGELLAGFGLLPVKDLTEERLDRAAILLLRGPSAEVSFE